MSSTSCDQFSGRHPSPLEGAFCRFLAGELDCQQLMTNIYVCCGVAPRQVGDIEEGS
jgi:hypothetical protein